MALLTPPLRCLCSFAPPLLMYAAPRVKPGVLGMLGLHSANRATFPIFFICVFSPCSTPIPPTPSHSTLPPPPNVTTAVEPAIPIDLQKMLLPCAFKKKKMFLSRDFQQLLLVESRHLLPASSGERRAGVGGTWSLHSHPRNLATKGTHGSCAAFEEGLRRGTEQWLPIWHCLSGGLSLECPLPPPTKHLHDGFSSV